MKIILDLDGTLIKKNGEISSRVLSFFHKNSINMDVTICTGRFSDYVFNITKKLKLNNSYHICDGDGRIIDDKGNTIWIREIDSQVIKVAQDIQNEFDVDLVFSDIENNRRSSASAQIILRRVKDESLKLIVKKFSNCSVNIQKVWYWEGHGYTLSITSQYIDKAYALNELSKIEDFSLASSVMIADGDNDISCFKICGTKIAMGNSSEKLKKIADYCVDTVDNDGAIHALESILRADK